MSSAPHPPLGRLIYLAAILYALAIFFISSIPGLTPPTLGFVWEDKFYHFLEFGILGLLLYLAFSRRVYPRHKKAFWLALAIGILYAAVDEIHQLRVANRQADFWDFIADSVGIITFATVTYLVQSLLKSKSKQPDLT